MFTIDRRNKKPLQLDLQKQKKEKKLTHKRIESKEDVHEEVKSQNREQKTKKIIRRRIIDKNNGQEERRTKEGNR